MDFGRKSDIRDGVKIQPPLRAEPSGRNFRNVQQAMAHYADEFCAIHAESFWWAAQHAQDFAISANRQGNASADRAMPSGQHSNKRQTQLETVLCSAALGLFADCCRSHCPCLLKRWPHHPPMQMSACRKTSISASACLRTWIRTNSPQSGGYRGLAGYLRRPAPCLTKKIEFTELPGRYKGPNPYHSHPSIPV